MSAIHVALVHYPVLDRDGAFITTAITNLDLHDIARTCCTYGVRTFFVVHPIDAQRELARRIQSHWVGGSGAKRIPTREPAMRLIDVLPALEDVYARLGGRQNVDLYATSAQLGERPRLALAEGRARIQASLRPSLILLGTGWGLAPSLLGEADAVLDPIRGASPTGYNHLSVRAACAILIDRLVGPQ